KGMSVSMNSGGSATSVGAIVALNRVHAETSASIDDLAELQAAGAVTVLARNAASIAATVIAPVVAIGYNLGLGEDNDGEARSVSVGFVLARNAIRAAVSASVTDVADLTASGLSIRADQDSL